MKKLSFVLILLSVFATNLFASNDIASIRVFNQELNKVYADYRVALFQTNKKNQENSVKATTRFYNNWYSLYAKYGDQAPEVYRADPNWKPTLQKINQLATQGLQEVKNRKLADAHETLELIRDELAALRQRNNIIVFSDHVNRYHEQMEKVITKKYTTGSFDEMLLIELRERLAILDYLADDMKQNAPAEYNNNPEFKKLLGKNIMVLKSFRTALDSKEPATIMKAIKELKPAYAKLFVKFG